MAFVSTSRWALRQLLVQARITVSIISIKTQASRRVLARKHQRHYWYSTFGWKTAGSYRCGDDQSVRWNIAVASSACIGWWYTWAWRTRRGTRNDGSCGYILDVSREKRDELMEKVVNVLCFWYGHGLLLILDVDENKCRLQQQCTVSESKMNTAVSGFGLSIAIRRRGWNCRDTDWNKPTEVRLFGSSFSDNAVK